MIFKVLQKYNGNIENPSQEYLFITYQLISCYCDIIKKEYLLIKDRKFHKKQIREIKLKVKGILNGKTIDNLQLEMFNNLKQRLKDYIYEELEADKQHNEFIKKEKDYCLEIKRMNFLDKKERIIELW